MSALLRTIGSIVAFCAALYASAAPPLEPSNLRVNSVIDPVGTSADIAFGWWVNDPDPNEVQTAWQVVVATDEANLNDAANLTWDSGKRADDRQNHVAYSGPNLRSGTRYFWKVRTWDASDAVSPWSRAAHFDVGLLSNDDWDGASWIRRTSSNKDDYTRFRKEMVLPPKPIRRAIVYLAATHRFELRINDVAVGKGQAYQYPDRHYYQAYDITSRLTPGARHTLAVRTHWFGGGQGRPAGERGLILRAVIQHSDGSETIVATDGTWRQSRSDEWVLDDLTPRNAGEGVGYVEHIDGRRVDPAWWSQNFDDSGWQPATVIGPHPVHPWTGPLLPDLTRIVESAITPSSIRELGESKYLIDVGKVWAGVPKIEFSGGSAGKTVTMRGAYELDDTGQIPLGTKSQNTNMEYRAQLADSDFIYEPAEYLGMRYFQIDNAPMPVTDRNFAFIARHIAADTASSNFESSDARLNAVWELMKHSLLTCAQEEFVDTPTREKGGFLGDAAIQSRAAMLVLNERLLTRRVLSEYLDSMRRYWSSPSDRGRMNAVYPNNDGGRDIPDFTQAYLPWVWFYYMETGDREFLAANWDTLRSIGTYLDRHVDSDTGLIKRLSGGSGPYEFGIIDWPAPMRYGYDMEAATRTVINGWAKADYDALARIAKVLGDAEAEAEYQRKSQSLGRAINASLLTEAGIYCDGLDSEGKRSPHCSQHASAFPLALGLVPPDQRATVVRHVRQQGMSMGMVTVAWLIRAIGEAGEGPHLVDLYTNPNRPGWACCLARGATATWESWDADETGQSQSHAWGAAGLEGYVRYILGIQPTTPQYAHVRIQPLAFGDRLEWARGKITTDRGPISVEWNSTDGAYRIEVVLPANVSADVLVPKGSTDRPRVTLDDEEIASEVRGEAIVVRDVGSGSHEVVRLDEP